MTRSYGARVSRRDELRKSVRTNNLGEALNAGVQVGPEGRLCVREMTCISDATMLCRANIERQTRHAPSPQAHSSSAS